jgi:hypothetical protein
MTMSDPDLLAEVLRRPAVLWAVLTSGVKIAGAWERVEHASRRQSAGWDRASVNECAEPAGTWIGWTTICPSASFASRAEAEAWCDARLREGGYLLVEAQGG